MFPRLHLLHLILPSAGRVSICNRAVHPSRGGVRLERRQTRTPGSCRTLCVREDQRASSPCFSRSKANSHPGACYVLRSRLAVYKQCYRQPFTDAWAWLAMYTRISILMTSSIHTTQVHHLEARIMAQNAAVANTRAVLAHQRQRGAVFPVVYALLWRPPDWRRYSCPSPVRRRCYSND